MLFLTLFMLLLGAVSCEKCPECLLTTPQLCEYNGYKFPQTRKVTTGDGYILTLHRLPPTKVHESGSSPVVFLQHGLLDSSATWVINGKASSAFLLADAGFDVWMGNVRGNTYSNAHVKYSIHSDQYWNFTFDDMAQHDLPTMIDYVLEETNQTSLYYFGHSQGSEIAFIGFSNNQQLAKKVKMFVALAPVARVDHVKGFFKYLSSYQSTLESFFRMFGIREFMPSNWLLKMFATVICPWDEKMCENIMFMMAGFDKSNLDLKRVEVIESHCPAGTSTKNVIHWSQMIKAKRLQKYDFEDPQANVRAYGQTTPPEYIITGLNVPTVLVAGGQDWLGDPLDELWLMEKIHSTVIEIIFIDYYNHLDMIWGIDAPQKIYQPLIELINKSIE